MRRMQSLRHAAEHLQALEAAQRDAAESAAAREAALLAQLRWGPCSSCELLVWAFLSRTLSGCEGLSAVVRYTTCGSEARDRGSDPESHVELTKLPPRQSCLRGPAVI